MRADVRMMHGVLYLRGTICLMCGSEIKDLKQEMEHIAHILRQRTEIRDVVLDCSFVEADPKKPKPAASGASLR